MVYHILSDGTITKDITGRVVKIADAQPLYNLMKDLRGTRKNEKGGLKACQLK